MKFKALLGMMVVCSLLLGAAPALGQTPPITGVCNGVGSIQGPLSLTPDQGPAGSSTMVAGSFEVFPLLSQQEGPVVQAFWLETGFDDAMLLGEFPITIDETDPENLIASFGGSIMVPAGAAPGIHTVALMLEGASDPSCLEFTVTEAVRQDAYPQDGTATILPSTGAEVIVPLALLAAGLAIYASRRRSA